LSWICTTVGEIMNGNWKFPFFFFKVFLGITLPKNNEPWQNSNLTCAFLWLIHILNLS
jgi:hypothetical protein